ncbi:BREX-3 system P-loop-containing protein BrxF [Moorella naiadis]|uniref:BREX-3 system P-loop-containing protein BrxF n=1 Tax=Moorella naiadis (nom. illeg.) TaxID=3093670 RepID=UPI003D9C8E1E
MVEYLSEQVIPLINQAARLYHRLIIIAGPAGAGKTTTLQDIQQRTGALLINVNLELSRQLLELNGRQRTLQLPRLLSEIINAAGGEVVLLDNIELLFDPALQQDPLRLLQGLSRNKTLVVAWNGAVHNGYLTYAQSGHPEYRRYPSRDLLIVSPEKVELR